MKKRIAAAALAFLIVMIALSVSSCSGKAPELDDVRDRIVYLIEGSKEINVLLFGDGLPTYERDGILENELGIYYNDQYTSYNRVMENARYDGVDDMKAAAERIYSEEYLSAIYESAFDGFLTGSSSAYVRFLETEEWLFQNRGATSFTLTERIYDYSTIEIVKPSSDKYMNITIECYTLENKVRKTLSLSFVYERGNWYLDTPTY